MTENSNRKLLKKYINQQCNASELQQVRQLLQQAEGQKELEHLLDEDWKQFSAPDLPEVELRRWKMRFYSLKASNSSTGNPTIYRFFYAAAACLLMAILTWFWKSQNQSDSAPLVKNVEQLNPAGQRSKVVLPDSSVVYLGPASCLSYPEKFGKDKRQVWLEGEAFFEVRRDEKKPFLVRTGSIQTRVLGTSFKIDSRERRVVVAVATGKVRVSETHDGRMQALANLSPGGKIAFNEINGNVNRGHLDPSEIKGWKDGKLFFNNTSLEEIAIILSRWYNIQIHIVNNDLKAYRLTLSADGTEPLKHILEIISSTANINYKIQNQTVLLEKKEENEIKK
ncbi:FecR family protein [Desertivirga brevis]|uniref:FecR family protein n=1 Tax=Desertivirga brevis TaxID=2810310 RepID=UPI001A97487D|nr:FecR domain-containing protein [Pedobacter sp. SYSU D00873]